MLDYPTFKSPFCDLGISNEPSGVPSDVHITITLIEVQKINQINLISCQSPTHRLGANIGKQTTGL